jgi:hypothetical protein
MSPTAVRQTTTPLYKTLTSLSHELKGVQRDPAPTLSLIENLAERTWKANIEFERRILQLEREKKDLARAMNQYASSS